ncbi:MAG: autotransporter outer membrane beta-barrel domain-containing protein [Alphaproteobacteria bacterium]|nr:autotransporter outer membrane beta-barrel domain-containing protein [Alphaproteobacteria bacterium]
MKIIFSIFLVIPIICLSHNIRAACDAPNFDGCKIDEADKVIVVDKQEDVSITNSTMAIGSLIFTADNLNLNMSNSTLDANRLIPSNYNYKINIDMDNSKLTLRNANSINMEDVNLKNKSTFTVQGYSSVSVNNFESTGDSLVKIKNSFSILSLKTATLEDVYLTAGFLRIQENTVDITNIENTDPDDTARDYEDLNKGGYIEITNKGTLNVHNTLKANQIHMISGALNIEGTYEIGALDNKSSSSIYDKDDKIVNINSNSDGKITYINLNTLNLSGTGVLHLQNGGSISNLNDSNTLGGTLEYLGLKIPDKNGNIPENAPVPTLTLRNTYLDTLIIQDGNVKITSSYSTINNITGNGGSLTLEYVKNMKSDNVAINSLSLYSSNYDVSGTFSANNLTLSNNSVLNLSGSVSSLTFDTLSLNSGSKITSANLDIKINNSLNIFNSLQEVNSLEMLNDSTLTIGIDRNTSKLTDGISATGSITLNKANIIANLQDTSDFNLGLNQSYYVLHADGISWDNTNLGSTNLPDWFSAEFRFKDINNPKDLIVDITRKETYAELLSKSNYAGDTNTLNIARVLDRMVGETPDNNNFTPNLRKVITNIDLSSDRNTIGSNLASLRPVPNNVYISDIHTTASIYLDLLSQNSSYAYLKTKDSEDTVLWIRNGFKIGSSKAGNFYSGSRNNTYFLMGGFDIVGHNFDSSYLQLGVAGGFNVNDIKANDNLYDINASGFNAGIYANYIAEKFSLSLSSMYLTNMYDTTRLPLQSKVSSTSKVAEMASSISLAYKTNLHDNISIKPSIFYTNGYITADKTREDGLAGFNLPSYSATIHDAGVGALFYTDFKETIFNLDILQGSYSPYMDLKTFYRMYDVPHSNINFIDTTYDINIIGMQKNSLVMRGAFGVDYEKNSNVLGINYTYERSFHNYANHQFRLNYKLLLN